MDELELVVSEESGNHLVDLQQGKVPANTHMGSAAKLQEKLSE